MHGWLILNKPAGITSAKAVSVVKKILSPSKIGHGGTLDPMATGVLPLALGEATKAFQYVVMQQKSYQFTIKWGIATSSDDSQGEPIAQSLSRPSAAQIIEILPNFVGDIMQAPPKISAVKIAGKAAYKRVRAGEELTIAPRKVRIDTLELTANHFNVKNHQQVEESEFVITCGKGTYIRSLARDMGEMLGCYGHITSLKRIFVGKFHIKQAISLDDLQKMDYEAALAALLPIEQVLDDIPAVSMQQQQVNRLLQGQTAVPVQAGITFRSKKLLRCHRIDDWKFVALAKPVGSYLKPVRVFNV